MNRLQRLFKNKRERILSIFFTAGFPGRDDTMDIIQQLDRAGVDLVEVGIPFSDPLADGPVIQHSNQVAIQNGMTLGLLFEQLTVLRKRVDLPVLLMGYLNPVLQFGPEKFVAACARVGIDGYIIPDLTEGFFEKRMRNSTRNHGLARVRLIAPGSSDERIREIDDTSDGFNYVVSSHGTTGSQSLMNGQAAYLDRVNRLALKNPRLVGFGVHDRTTFEAACRHGQGAIVGSAFIRNLDNALSIPESVKPFVQSIR